MGRVFNMPRKLTDVRKFSKEGKLALAAWLSIKFSYGNSTLYDMSVDGIVRFFHVRRDRAKKLLRLMWADDELFFMNEKKNCIFAKSCKDKTPKTNRIGGRYCSDDVITIEVPECYLRDKEHKESLPLVELVRLIERALVCREYDDHSGYKYQKGDHEGCDDHCGTPEAKTQLYVSKRTGLSRTKVGRILREYVKFGVMNRTECHIERCRKGERYSFKAVNRKTRMPYWAKCVPVQFSFIKEPPFRYRHIIWDAVMRSRSKIMAEVKSGLTVINNADFDTIVARQLAMRAMYD